MRDPITKQQGNEASSRLGVLGDQQPVTTRTSLFLRFSANFPVRQAINVEAQSAPKVDDPVRRLSGPAFGIRQGKRTRLDEYVAVVKGSLDKVGSM